MELNHPAARSLGMGRPRRIHFPGAVYHVFSRGNARQNIFLEDSDYQMFLLLLAAEKNRSPFELFGYCLMPNHLHLLIRVAKQPLRIIMKRILGRYARFFNIRCKRTGHVFESRYKAPLCCDDIYLKELLRYIHLNPVRAELCSRPEQWLWSSHAHYLGMRAEPFVDSAFPLSMFGNDPRMARKFYADFVSEGLDCPPPLLTEDLPEIPHQTPTKGKEVLDLAALAARIERRRGLGEDVLRGPCRSREVAAARKEFAIEAYACGFGPGAIACFIGRSCSAVCRMVRPPGLVPLVQ